MASPKRFIAIISHPATLIGVAVVIGALSVVFALRSTKVAPTGAYTTVAVGSTTAEVDVTGVIQAAQNTSLAFQIPGQIADINVAVGQRVSAGQTLLTLTNASQEAALAQAQAALKVQQANLASLRAGTRPEELAIDQVTVSQARSALIDTMQSAYLAADDAVHVKADAVFTNPRTSAAQIAFPVPDAVLVNTVQSERISLEPVFASWQAMSFATATDVSLVSDTVSQDLNTVSVFLDNLAKALTETPPGNTLSATALAGYQASVNAARLEVSNALSALTASLSQYRTAEGALTLAEAGATSDQITAQEAAVDAAQAAVLSAQVALSQTVLAAPISGTVSVQGANPGETVTPGVPLISLIAIGRYQAVAQVSQTDIADIKIGDPVIVTSDTYPGTSFSAAVTQVDPSATVVNGVSSYGVTVTFTKDDPRLSSGLSANLRIITATRQGVLLIPQSALVTSNGRSFVYDKTATGTVEMPVVVGVENANSGMVEITSGLSEGQQILTFGGTVSH